MIIGKYSRCRGLHQNLKNFASSGKLPPPHWAQRHPESLKLGAQTQAWLQQLEEPYRENQGSRWAAFGVGGFLLDTWLQQLEEP